MVLGAAAGAVGCTFVHHSERALASWASFSFVSLRSALAENSALIRCIDVGFPGKPVRYIAAFDGEALCCSGWKRGGDSGCRCFASHRSNILRCIQQWG